MRRLLRVMLVAVAGFALALGALPGAADDKPPRKGAKDVSTVCAKYEWADYGSYQSWYAINCTTNQPVNLNTPEGWTMGTCPGGPGCEQVISRYPFKGRDDHFTHSKLRKDGVSKKKKKKDAIQTSTEFTVDTKWVGVATLETGTTMPAQITIALYHVVVTPTDKTLKPKEFWTGAEIDASDNPPVDLSLKYAQVKYAKGKEKAIFVEVPARAQVRRAGGKSDPNSIGLYSVVVDGNTVVKPTEAKKR